MTGLARLLSTLHDGSVEFIIVGGVAATAHGSAYVTQDLDILYARNDTNLERIVTALRPLEPYRQGIRPGLPFEWSVATLRAGLNFKLTTKAGDLDLLGEIIGGGAYADLAVHAITAVAFDRQMRILELPWLIRLKRAAGLPRDLEVIAELEALWEEIADLDEASAK